MNTPLPHDPPGLFDILAHVPLWVWAVLTLILVLGTQQSRDQLVSRARLLILPAVWLAFGAWGVAASFGLSAPAALAWAGGLALSALGVRWLGWPGQAAFLQARAKFRVPGSWGPLALMLSLFAAKFALGASLALHPDWAALQPLAAGFSLLFGLLGGAFLGRALNILARSHA